MPGQCVAKQPRRALVLVAVGLVLLVLAPRDVASSRTLRRHLQDTATTETATSTRIPVGGTALTFASELEPATATATLATPSAAAASSFVWEPLEPTQPSVAPSPVVTHGKNTEEIAMSAPEPFANAKGTNPSVATHKSRPAINLGPVLLGAIGICCVGLAAFAAKRRKQPRRA